MMLICDTTAYQRIVIDSVHPFMTTVCAHFLIAASIKYYIISVILDMTYTQMAYTATRFQSNRVPLGCGLRGDSYYGHAAEKSAATL